MSMVPTSARCVGNDALHLRQQPLYQFRPQSISNKGPVQGQGDDAGRAGDVDHSVDWARMAAERSHRLGITRLS